jgi:hypothetical protein
LTVDQKQRPSAEQLLQHEWLKSDEAPGLKDPEARDGSFRNLLPQVQRGFNAKNTWRSAFAKFVIRSGLVASDAPTQGQGRQHVQGFGSRNAADQSRSRRGSGFG